MTHSASTVRHPAHAAARCNMLQHAATRCNTLTLQRVPSSAQRTYVVCGKEARAVGSHNTLQHTAIRCNICNTLQHTATHTSIQRVPSTMQHKYIVYDTESRALASLKPLQHTATHCNTLQHTHTCSACHRPCDTSTLCATGSHALFVPLTRCNTLQHTATHTYIQRVPSSIQHKYVVCDKESRALGTLAKLVRNAITTSAANVSLFT